MCSFILLFFYFNLNEMKKPTRERLYVHLLFFYERILRSIISHPNISFKCKNGLVELSYNCRVYISISRNCYTVGCAFRLTEACNKNGNYCNSPKVTLNADAKKLKEKEVAGKACKVSCHRIKSRDLVSAT